jgi:hypothetical protein
MGRVFRWALGLGLGLWHATAGGPGPVARYADLRPGKLVALYQFEGDATNAVASARGWVPT